MRASAGDGLIHSAYIMYLDENEKSVANPLRAEKQTRLVIASFGGADLDLDRDRDLRTPGAGIFYIYGSGCVVSLL